MTTAASATTASWRRDLIWLVIVLGVWFGYSLGSRALWTPDEGRYAEIPREMLASGDLLTPRLNGVKYFEKPPLMYWLTAGAFKVFGLSEWSARLWLGLFALLGCLAVYAVGRKLYDRRAGLFAAGVLATSPLYAFMGGILTLDIPVAALITAALSAFLIGINTPDGVGRRLLLYAFYVSMALAVLTKGLIGIVIPGMVIGAWILLLNQWRLLREIYLPTGLLLFAVIAVPWHVLVSQANPEFAQFYFIHEHLERFVTTKHQRPGPLWFYIPIILFGMYPWIVFAGSAVRDVLPRLWRERHQHADLWFLLLWAALPFAFFSFAGSKLIPYILPVFPPLALLLGRWLARVWERTAPLGRLAFPPLLLLGAALAAAFLFAPQLWPHSEGVARTVAQFGWGFYAMVAAMFLSGALPFLGWFKRHERNTIALLFVGAALFVSAFQLSFPRLDAGRSVKSLTEVLAPILKPGDEVVSYGEYFQDLPYYLRRRVTVADWIGELEFGSSVEDTRDWIIDEATLRRRWQGPKTVYLLTQRSNYDKLRANPPGPMRLLAQTDDVVLAVNREAAP